MLLAGGPSAALASGAADRYDAAGRAPLIAVAHVTYADTGALFARLTGAHLTGAPATTVTASSSPHPCNDGKYRLFGPRWTSTLKWSFNAWTTPSSLDKTAALTVITRGLRNIVYARNDCGRPDNVSATIKYLGTTKAALGVNKYGRCARGDGRNVVGFGSLPDDILGVACIRSDGGRIYEADIRLTNRVRWALSTSNCFNRYMLEAVMTHEAGHAFGLAHVSEKDHGRLTMSSHINGPCQNSEATLGLGDMKGLEALY